MRQPGGMTKDTIRSFFASSGVPLGLKSDAKDKLIGLAIDLMSKEPARFEKLKHSRFTSHRVSFLLHSLVAHSILRATPIEQVPVFRRSCTT